MLAIDGGKPIRSSMLPYGRQYIDQNDLNAVCHVLTSDFLTTGPTVEAFERKLAQRVGAQYAVAFSNGTAALHAACYAADIQTQDEVITTPMTFAASANCILYMGGKPVFSDIDKETYNIDAMLLEKAITPRTKAIIPVHFTGQAAEMDLIHEIAQRFNLTVIEDAAHALGTYYHGDPIGSLSKMTTFSFHPVKTVTTGEGGAVTTNSPELYQKLRLFRSHGITRQESDLLDKEQGAWYYEQQDLGYNYRMTDIQAALGSSQLDKLDIFKARRNEIVLSYDNAFVDVEGVQLQKRVSPRDTCWHLYILQIKLDYFNVDRKEIFNALRAENIGVNVHYIPVYWHPFYRSLGYPRGLCPNTEHLYKQMITLPLFVGMTDQDVDDVISAVKKVLNHYRKRSY